jgi:hypothetical protein
MSTEFIEFSIPPFITKLNKNGEEKKKITFPVNWRDTTTSLIKANEVGRAIQTGIRSGITVIDFDDMDVYNLFLVKFPELVDIYKVKTRNGVHMYFSYNAILKSTTNVMLNFPKVDIRNDGGCVIAPPTSYKGLDKKTYTYEKMGGLIYSIPDKVLHEIKKSVTIGYVDDEVNNAINEIEYTDDNLTKILDFAQLLDHEHLNDYTLWRNLVWSIRSMGANFKHVAQAISRKGDNYDKRSFYRVWNDYNVNKSSNISSNLFYSYCRKSNLVEYKKLIKKYNMNAESEKIVEDYLVRDFTGITVKTENSKYIMCVHDKLEDEWIIKHDETVESTKHVIFWADLGKGKTECIKYCLDNQIKSKPDHYNILFLSSRQSFANFIEHEFAKYGIENYSKFTKDKIIRQSRLVIQMESLHKIDPGIIYDCVVIDESESCLMQMSSSTLTETIKVFDTLLRVIQKSKKVLYCDGFLLNRTIQFCKNVRQNDEEIICIHNTLPTNSRSAVQISNESFDNAVIDNYKKGIKTYVCSTSRPNTLVRKIKIETITEHTENTIIQSYKSLFYEKETSKEMCEALKDVNKTWGKKEIKIVEATPKITIGLSYNYKDFINCFIDGCNSLGATPRDVLQMMMRVRHIESNTVHFTLPTKVIVSEKKLKLFATFEEYIDMEENKRKIIFDYVKANYKGKAYDDFVKDFERYTCVVNPILKQVLQFNMREKIVSQLHFGTLLTRLMKDMSYEIITIEDKSKRDKIDDKDESKYEERFNKIESIDYEDVIKCRKDNNESSQEKIDKYFFNMLWNNNTIEKTKAFLFYEFYRNSFKKHIIYNMKVEKSKQSFTDMVLSEIQLENGIIVNMPMLASKKVIVQNLNTLMELEHSQDTKVIIDKKCMTEKVYEYLRNNLENITTIFSSNVKMTGNNRADNSSLFKLLKSIYGKWASSTLHKIESTKTYQLSGTDIYSNINDEIDMIKYNIDSDED